MIGGTGETAGQYVQCTRRSNRDLGKRFSDIEIWEGGYVKKNGREI